MLLNILLIDGGFAPEQDLIKVILISRGYDIHIWQLQVFALKFHEVHESAFRVGWLAGQPFIKYFFELSGALTPAQGLVAGVTNQGVQIGTRKTLSHHAQVPNYGLIW